ncbi:MAG: hypothetical protein ACRBN8_35265 [Nannocystales bacterium]
MQLPALVGSFPDAPTLARAVLAQEATPLGEVASFLGAPAVELEASAISARIAIAAANEGRCFVHHEHRLSPLLPEGARPEIDVGMDDDAFVPEQWREGVLHVPKYFSAFLEGPLPVFHPSHRSKWRPHELLHRLARFAWRPELTRFEAYLSARLSELLPVVHWYGFDEIGRHTCPEHAGTRPDRTLCERCEQSLVPAWQADTAPEHAEAAAAHALEHLETELDACERELSSGRIVSTPRPGLDASSDAVGYLRAHWNRLTAWSFGAWVERFADVGVDRFESCADHLAHVRELANGLLTQPYALAPHAERVAARERRTASDLAYRLLLHIEALDSDEAEDALMPCVDALAGGHPTQDTLRELPARLRALDPDVADRTVAGGWGWLPTTDGARTSLIAGLRTALPRALEGVDVAGLARDFAEADEPQEPRALAARFADYLEQQASPHCEAASFEAWLRQPPGADLEAERFGGLPEDLDAPGRVRVNTTLRRDAISRDTLDTVLGEDPEGSDAPIAAVVAIRWAGEPRVLEETPEVQAALEAADTGVLSSQEATEDLLEQGFIVWFPPVR